jgi:GNAT superfamily N-acetyltransferase
MTTEFNPYTIRDKCDAAVCIRRYAPDSETDARDMLALGRAVAGAGIGVTALPEDLPRTVEAEQNYFREFTASAHNVVIVAEIENRIVGAVHVHALERRKLAHNATLGLSVLPEYQARGIGRLLMNAVVAWARANPAITRIRLEPNDDQVTYTDEILMWLNVE